MIETQNFPAAKMAQTWCYRLYFAKGWREAASGRDVRNSVGAASLAGKILPITVSGFTLGGVSRHSLSI